MAAEQVEQFVDPQNQIVSSSALSKPAVGANRHHGDAQDALDIAEMSGHTESRVRVEIKKLQRQKEIPEHAGIVRKRPDGRKTIHYRDPVLAKILSAVSLIPVEETSEE